MLTRLNTTSEISILPIGLGNHYQSGTNHLIPPGRRKLPYSRSNSIFSKASIDNNNVDDPNAPEANMSFRAQNDYFGPDVLVILGVVLASGGAILTLVSFYCQFKHPAIQATIAGIGPSLVGIGMLFCVLRLFFCSFFTTRTCCECLGDGFRYLATQCPFVKKFQRMPVKKKVHPLQGKTAKTTGPSSKTVVNGELKQKTAEAVSNDKREKGYGNSKEQDRNTVKVKQKLHNSNQVKLIRQNATQAIEMATVPISISNGIERFPMPHLPQKLTQNSRFWNSVGEKQLEMDETSVAIAEEKDVTKDLIGNCDDLEVSDHSSYSGHHGKDDEEILKDEIAILDKRLNSANSSRVLNQGINELVLNRAKI